jgi:hypothetical protein
MATKTKKAATKAPDFDYTTIKSFEDACEKLGMDPTKLPDVSGIPEEFVKPIIANYKLHIVYKAINNGWKPDWSNWNQYKYFPWYRVLSSGFGFSHADYHCDYSFTCVGSRLCTGSSVKAMYIAEQFKDLYKDYSLYTE